MHVIDQPSEVMFHIQKVIEVRMIRHVQPSSRSLQRSKILLSYTSYIKGGLIPPIYD